MHRRGSGRRCPDASSRVRNLWTPRVARSSRKADCTSTSSLDRGLPMPPTVLASRWWSSSTGPLPRTATWSSARNTTPSRGATPTTLQRGARSRASWTSCAVRCDHPRPPAPESVDERAAVASCFDLQAAGALLFRRERTPHRRTTPDHGAAPNTVQRRQFRARPRGVRRRPRRVVTPGACAPGVFS